MISEREESQEAVNDLDYSRDRVVQPRRRSRRSPGDTDCPNTGTTRHSSCRTDQTYRLHADTHRHTTHTTPHSPLHHQRQQLFTLCPRKNAPPLSMFNKNSSGDEIANVNFSAVRPEGIREFGEITQNNAITPFNVIQGHRFWY